MDGTEAMRRLQRKVTPRNVPGGNVRLVTCGQKEAEAMYFHITACDGAVTIIHDATGFIVNRSDDLCNEHSRRVDLRDGFAAAKRACLAIVAEMAASLQQKEREYVQRWLLQSRWESWRQSWLQSWADD